VCEYHLIALYENYQKTPEICYVVAQFGVVFSSVLKSDPALVVIYILMAGLSGPSD